MLSRGKKKILDKWLTNGCSLPARRFSILSYSHSAPLHPSLSFRPRLLLPPPPLPSLPRPRSYSTCFPSMSSMTTPKAASYSSQASPTKTLRVVIKGRVQGVFYRNWTVENATQLGLKGWVRNGRDGSVEALFSGSPDAVQEMKQRFRCGPPDAMVAGLEIFSSNDDPGTGFGRKPTVCKPHIYRDYCLLSILAHGFVVHDLSFANEIPHTTVSSSVHRHAFGFLSSCSIGP